MFSFLFLLFELAGSEEKLLELKSRRRIEMIYILAVLKGAEEIKEKFFFFFEIVLGLLLNCFHMLEINFDSLSLELGKDLPEGQPIFFIKIPHIFWLTWIFCICFLCSKLFYVANNVLSNISLRKKVD